jgi:phosphoribosylanthranilate isomerase
LDLLDGRQPTTFFMTWVKICGITNLEDALVAVEAGADALGFVFYAKSPRNVDPESVAKISSSLPDSVERVGVIVPHSIDDITFVARTARVTALQLHLSLMAPLMADPTSTAEMDAFATARKIFLALPAGPFIERKSSPDFAALRGNGLPKGIFDTVFLDSGTPLQPGGTGRPFDWKAAAPLVADMSKQVSVVLAGGLSPENVAQAMGILHPWGVDVSSGVEASPGKKDPEKVRAFIRAVRTADKASQN